MLFYHSTNYSMIIVKVDITHPAAVMAIKEPLSSNQHQNQTQANIQELLKFTL